MTQFGWVDECVSRTKSYSYANFCDDRRCEFIKEASHMILCSIEKQLPGVKLLLAPTPAFLHESKSGQLAVVCLTHHLPRVSEQSVGFVEVVADYFVKALKSKNKNTIYFYNVLIPVFNMNHDVAYMTRYALVDDK